MAKGGCRWFFLVPLLVLWTGLGSEKWSSNLDAVLTLSTRQSLKPGMTIWMPCTKPCGITFYDKSHTLGGIGGQASSRSRLHHAVLCPRIVMASCVVCAGTMVVRFETWMGRLLSFWFVADTQAREMWDQESCTNSCSCRSTDGSTHTHTGRAPLNRNVNVLWIWTEPLINLTWTDADRPQCCSIRWKPSWIAKPYVDSAATD